MVFAGAVGFQGLVFAKARCVMPRSWIDAANPYDVAGEASADTGENNGPL